MKYSLEKSYQILERTPSVLRTLLSGLDDGWVMNNEGPDTFSPYDVIGHLIHGEKTDWAARTKLFWSLDYQNHLFHGIGLPSMKKAKAKHCRNCWMNLTK